VTPTQVGADVSSTMTRMSRAVNTAIRSAMKESGATAKKEMESGGKRHTGGDLRFSNMGGARLGVRVRQGDNDVTVSSSGPWGILQPGAGAHSIRSKRRSGVLRIGGELRRGPFKHPGTANTRAWDRGQDATFERLEIDVPKLVETEVAGAFNG
jgi:hypothetical protein